MINTNTIPTFLHWQNCRILSCFQFPGILYNKVSGCPSSSSESAFANLMFYFNKNAPPPQRPKGKTNSFHCMQKMSTIQTSMIFFSFCRCIVNFPGQAWTLHRCYFESIRIELVGKISYVIVSQVLSPKLNILFIEKVTDQNNSFHLVNKYQLLINREAFTIRVESLFTWFSFCFFFFLRRTRLTKCGRAILD